MAGQAGNVSAFNTVWTYDIYRAVINPKASDSHLVWMGRAATIVGILLSVVTAYVAMQFNTIMDYIQAIFSWVNAPLFATFLLGMFWKRTTSTAAFVGLICGMITSFSIFIGFKLYGPAMSSSGLAQILTSASEPSEMSRNLWQATWGWGVCFVVTLGLSFVTKPKTDAELEGLVKGLTPKTEEGNVPLMGRPIFWAAISLAVLVALNIYFW